MGISLKAVAVTRGLLSLALAFLLQAGPATAQVGAEAPLVEPQDLNVLLRRVNDTFLPLELQRVGRQYRSALLSTTVEEYLDIPGARSPVRFSARDRLTVYLRIYVNEDDPRSEFFTMRDPTRFTLVKLQPEKKTRRLSLLKSGLTSTTRAVSQPLLIRLYGEQSFTLSPAEPLEPGEYAIKYLTDDEDDDDDAPVYDLFCFGVDP